MPYLSNPTQDARKTNSCAIVRGVWFAAVAGTGAWTAGIATTNANCAGTARRRHSVASHPHSVNNSQSAHVTTATNTSTTMITTTATTTITTTTTTMTITITATVSATTTTTTATISHQRTLSLPLAAVIINQTQSSKRSVLRCMYFVPSYLFNRTESSVLLFSVSACYSLFPFQIRSCPITFKLCEAANQCYV